MRLADITGRMAGLGGQKWVVHHKARAMKAAGQDVIELTIGEPDVPTPEALMDVAVASMRAGRTGYSNGRGEPALVRALADRYTARRGRVITPEQVMCFPGTQTTLYVVLMGLLQAGDEVIVGDPLYATYEGLIAASGARAVPVPLRAERGFRMDPADIAARITPATRVIFLNSPHNPTGAVIPKADLQAIGEIARKHDLWILSDEVYEDLVFAGTTFTSALDLPEFADRVIVAASISKSHAAPGFRGGWCVGPESFCTALMPLSETMLFGGAPFIADMVTKAVSEPSPVAAGMCERFARRAALFQARLDGQTGLRVHVPQAGMFALLDVRARGMSGEAFALALLEAEGVAMMPGESFGAALGGWLRVALTQPDAKMEEACRRILRFVTRS
jgi:arginine:pyruvate transaminase